MDKLGIEPIQLLTQLVNFSLMVFILTKLLYRPITKALEDRKKKIEEGLAASEKAKLEAEKTEKKRTELLAKAREEARDIIEASKKEGKRQEAEIITRATEEAHAIIARGKKDVEDLRVEMEKQLKLETVHLSKLMVEKILSDTLTDKNHKKIIDTKLRAIARNVS